MNLSVGNCSNTADEFVMSCTLFAVIRKYSTIDIAPSTLVRSITSLSLSSQAHRESCNIKLKRITYIYPACYIRQLILHPFRYCINLYSYAANDKVVYGLPY